MLLQQAGVSNLFLLKCLDQVNFFDEYQMEGVSSDANEICLEVTAENLSRALKTVQNSKVVKVKLTKKHCPCLTVAAELVSARAAASDVCQSAR